MSYTEERQVRALETIARALETITRELHGIGVSLKSLDEKTLTPFRDPVAIKAIRENKSPGKCAVFDTECIVCERWLGKPCSWLVKPTEAKNEEEPNAVALCRCTNLECVFCNPGACDHRFVNGGGGNG